MPSGFFYGGLSEGIDSANKQNLAERTLAQEAGLRSRGLDIQERQVQRSEQQDFIKRADEQIAGTMGVVSETIKNGLAVGRDPAAIGKAVQPLVESAKQIASRVGRDPRSLDAQVGALLTSPTGVQTATAAGQAEGTKTATAQITAENVLRADQKSSGGDSTDTPGGFIIDPAKRGEAENRLRDDYQKATKEFTTLRDFKDRIDIAPKTGAGDISLVFSYMKVLDPTSTVREGEFATASNAAGVPSSVLALYNKIIGGGRLDEKARTEIQETANGIWKKANERQTALTNQYSGIAKRLGLNPKNVIIDPLADGGASRMTTPTGTSFRILP